MEVSATRPPGSSVKARTGSASEMGPAFPEGFRWGVATAAYQIEGAPDADGKGPSIWDTYAHTPGKIKNGDTGDVAIDHVNRYREDVRMIRDLGADAYRFSVSWPRIFPTGRGAPNPRGLDFYSRLVDTLLEAGIEPFATLYHWDLPQALQDEIGGWQSRETARAFGDYAGYVAEKLGDRIRKFFTINEFQSFIEHGYRGTELDVQGRTVRIEHAPGLKLGPKALNQVRHHAVLAHGSAVRAIRASGPSGIKVGPAEVMSTAIPVIATPEHVAAAEAATRDMNAHYLGVMLDGRYDDAYIEAAGADAPDFTDEDLAIIGMPLDFVGINVYRPMAFVMASDEAPGYREVPVNASHPKMLSSWHLFSPEVMYWAPRHLRNIWNPKEIYVTESGCAASDVIAEDGGIYDTDRVMYLRNVLMHLQRATAEGVPVSGNFVWSVFDNFEWADGYGTRFGMVYVNFETQERTPKLSAHWYREAATRNSVV